MKTLYLVVILFAALALNLWLPIMLVHGAHQPWEAGMP
jgi:hypothetical protein